MAISHANPIDAEIWTRYAKMDADERKAFLAKFRELVAKQGCKKEAA